MMIPQWAFCLSLTFTAFTGEQSIVVPRDLVPTDGAQLLKGVLDVRGVLHLPATPRGCKSQRLREIHTKLSAKTEGTYELFLMLIISC